jgi:hypothetical protein
VFTHQRTEVRHVSVYALTKDPIRLVGAAPQSLKLAQHSKPTVGRLDFRSRRGTVIVDHRQGASRRFVPVPSPENALDLITQAHGTFPIATSWPDSGEGSPW